MSKRDAALWVLTFVACAAVIVGVLVGARFLLSLQPDRKEYRDKHRFAVSRAQAFFEAKQVAEKTAGTVKELGPPQRAPQSEDWTKRLCDSLKVEGIPGTYYEVLSQRCEPAPQAYYVGVVHPIRKVKDRTGKIRILPQPFTFTVVVGASDRGDSKVVVLRSPDPSEARSGEPTVMVRLRSPNWDRLEEFVATPEFWEQAEPDLFAAFPGRSVDETPLPQFFEPFNPK